MTSMTGATGGNTRATATGKWAGDKIPSGYKAGQIQQYTPEQLDLFRSLFSQVGPDSYLSKLAGGDEGLFKQMEAPAMRQFAGLQGNIASRFSGQGMGARRSSGFQNAIGQAASDFSQDLQSKRQELQRQAIMDLMGLSSNLLEKRPYERFLSQKPENPWAEIVGKLGGAVPGLITSYLGGGSPSSAVRGAASNFNLMNQAQGLRG